MDLSQSEITVISSQTNDRAFFESGQLFTIVGFGQTESGDIGQKREAKVKLTKVESNEIELGGDGIDSCLGDSGGPAFFSTDDNTTFLVAVVSRGKKCGKGGRYGRVSQHACWIQGSSGITIPELKCDS
jgi:secreted trypsin-like serine protease